jgi:hypothetical protein
VQVRLLFRANFTFNDLGDFLKNAIFKPSHFVQPLSNFSVITASLEIPYLSTWYEGWGIAVIGAVIGGACTLLILLFTHDFNARKACCNTLYELKQLLEKLAAYARNGNRSEAEYYNVLKEMESVIEQLDVEVSGLCFRPPVLDELIFRSLELFGALDPDHVNPNFRPAYTASNLVQLWAPSKRLRVCSKQIIDCQKFLKRSFVSRAWSGQFFNRTITPSIEEKRITE